MKRVRSNGARGVDRVAVDDPTWEQVAEVLDRCGTPAVCRVELFNEDESKAMSIWGEEHAFFCCVCENETLYWYLSNGSQPADRLRELAGHAFDSHLVVEDRALVVQVARAFFVDGSIAAIAPWVREEVAS